MTQEQREFKIKKITSYEEQIKNLNEKATDLGIFAGLLGVLSLLNAVGLYNSQSEFYMIFKLTATVLPGVLSADNLRKLIDKICEKTMLKGKVEDIKFDLEMNGEEYQEEESRGKSR